MIFFPKSYCHFTNLRNVYLMHCWENTHFVFAFLMSVPVLLRSVCCGQSFLQYPLFEKSLKIVALWSGVWRRMIKVRSHIWSLQLYSSHQPWRKRAEHFDVFVSLLSRSPHESVIELDNCRHQGNHTANRHKNRLLLQNRSYPRKEWVDPMVSWK